VCTPSRAKICSRWCATCSRIIRCRNVSRPKRTSSSPSSTTSSPAERTARSVSRPPSRSEVTKNSPQPQTDVEPVGDRAVAIQLVPDLGAAERLQRSEVRDHARGRPIARAFAVAADGVRVPQPPVRGLRVVERWPRYLLAVRPRRFPQPKLRAPVELAVRGVLAVQQSREAADEMRRERVRVLEHPELGRDGKHLRSVALRQRTQSWSVRQTPYGLNPRIAGRSFARSRGRRLP
jgi:hypothetical protein